MSTHMTNEDRKPKNSQASLLSVAASGKVYRDPNRDTYQGSARQRRDSR